MTMTENKDDFGGELEIPDRYQKFFQKFEEIKTLDIEQWKTAHILGYFVGKFKVAYGTDYKFKYNSPSPSKCFEVFQIKKMSQLLSSKPKILKEYIDWIFSEKVEKGKKKFRSISFLTGEDILKEYKELILNDKPIDRTTLLPSNIITLLSPLNSNIGIIATYGDFAFYNKALGKEEWWQEKMKEAHKLYPEFDFTTLERIK